MSRLALGGLPTDPAARRRLLVLGGALVAAVGAAGWLQFAAPAAEEEVVTVATPRRARPAAPQAAPNVAPNVAPNAASNAAPDAAAPEVAATPDAAPTATPAATPAADSAPPPLRTGGVDTVVIARETFGYAAGGRRDPYRTLMTTTALRPLPGELRLTAVAYDPTGAQSVAILRDVTTKQQYRVRAGQLLGRMRVVRIRPKAIVFAIAELGFSRTEELALQQDSTAMRQQP